MNQMTIDFLRNHYTTLCTSVLMGSTDGTRAFCQWLPGEVARNPQVRVFLLEPVIRELEWLADDPSHTPEKRKQAEEGLKIVDALYNTGRIIIYSVPEGDEVGGRQFARAVLHVAKQFGACRLAVLTQSADLARSLVEQNQQLPSSQIVKVRRLSGRDGSLGSFNFSTPGGAASAHRAYPTQPLAQPVWEAAVQLTYPTAQPGYQAAASVPPVYQPAAPVAPPVYQPAAPVAPPVYQPAAPVPPVYQAAAPVARPVYQPAAPVAPPVSRPAAPVAKPVLTRRSKEPVKAPAVAEGSVLQGSDGVTYTLDEMLDGGAESYVYTVMDHPELVCKVLTEPTERKLAKISRLAELPVISGAVLPECTVSLAGQTVGYMMPMLDNAVPLIVLGTDSGLKRHASHFTRADFTIIALRVVSICEALMQHGVMVSDFSLTNIMIGCDENGRLSASRVFMIDMDSAQVTVSGAGQHEVIPGDGGTPDFLSPRLCDGFDEDTVRYRSDYEYMLTLMAFTIVMGVQHAFLACSDGDFDLRTAIRDGMFPLSRTNTLRSPLAYIFSYMTPGLKAVAEDCFTASASVTDRDADGDSFAGKFAPVGRLMDQLRHYHHWLGLPETLQRFPEALSLSPTSSKPYVKPGTSQQAYRPAAQPVHRQAMQPLPQPAVEPMPQPAVEPMPQPAVEPMPRPAVQAEPRAKQPMIERFARYVQNLMP